MDSQSDSAVSWKADGRGMISSVTALLFTGVFQTVSLLQSVSQRQSEHWSFHTYQVRIQLELWDDDDTEMDEDGENASLRLPVGAFLEKEGWNIFVILLNKNQF